MSEIRDDSHGRKRKKPFFKRPKVRHPANIKYLKRQYGDQMMLWVIFSHNADGSSETSHRYWGTVDGMVQYVRGQRKLHGIFEHQLDLAIIIEKGFIGEEEDRHENTQPQRD